MITREDARRICESRTYETGEGTCAFICMQELGSPRDKPHGCPHAYEVFETKENK